MTDIPAQSDEPHHIDADEGCAIALVTALLLSGSGVSLQAQDIMVDMAMGIARKILAKAFQAPSDSQDQLP